MGSTLGVNGFGEDKISCLYHDSNRGPSSPQLVAPGRYHYKNLTGQKGDKHRSGSLNHELTNKYITKTCITFTAAHRPDNVRENIMCSAVERFTSWTLPAGSLRPHPQRIFLDTNCSYTSITLHKNQSSEQMREAAALISHTDRSEMFTRVS